MTLDDTRILLWVQQGGRCAHCHGWIHYTQVNVQLAHRIPQRAWCIKRWGADVIHHPLNLGLVCGERCNAAVQLNPDSLPAEDLAKRIARQIKRGVRYGKTRSHR